MTASTTIRPRNRKGPTMISTKEAAALLGISDRRVRVLCEEGRIQGAERVGGSWVLPDKPQVIAVDRRRPGKVEMREPKKRKN